ncbi:cytochrome c peroxidase [Roseovarius sp. MBR-154]
MARPLKLILGTVSSLAQVAAASDLRERAQVTFAPLPSTIPALNDNIITHEKVDLGKALFFDPRMSASGVFSCNSCHNLATGGDDDMETSIGHA